MSANALDVNLMGREFRVACPPEEREALLAAVALVDGKMRELADKTRASGERLLAMAALNIAHEFLQLREASGPEAHRLKERIGHMRQRIDEALAQQEQLF